MLVLQFRAGQDLFGLAVKDIIEVAHLTALRKLPHAEAFVAGLLNYRGRMVPVLDLTALITGNPSRRLFSTRIILVNYKSAQEEMHVLGLIAEGATEVHKIQESSLQDPGIAIEDAPYLGKIWVDKKKTMQIIDLYSIIPAELRASLFAENEAGV